MPVRPLQEKQAILLNADPLIARHMLLTHILHHLTSVTVCACGYHASTCSEISSYSFLTPGNCLSKLTPQALTKNLEFGLIMEV